MSRYSQDRRRTCKPLYPARRRLGRISDEAAATYRRIAGLSNEIAAEAFRTVRPDSPSLSERLRAKRKELEVATSRLQTLVEGTEAEPLLQRCREVAAAQPSPGMSNTDGHLSRWIAENATATFRLQLTMLEAGLSGTTPPESRWPSL